MDTKMDTTKTIKSTKSLGSCYQKKIVLILCLVGFPASFHNLGYIFWAARPSHHCRVEKPDNLFNISDETWMTLVTPESKSLGNAKEHTQECYYNELNLSTFEAEDKGIIFEENAANYSVENERKKCSQWIYDTSQFQSTIVTEFDLVCDRHWLRSFTQSMYMAGKMIGTLLFGALADRFGRRVILLSTLVLQAIFGVVSAFASNIVTFMALRFAIALVITGTYEIAYVLAMEFVAPSAREITGSLFMITWAAGYMVFTLVAYFVRERFLLQLITMVPVVMITVLFWFVPESPRWLLLKKRYNAADKILNKISSGEEVKLKHEFEVKPIGETRSNKQVSQWKHVVGKPFLWILTIVLWFLWFTNSVVYFGLSFSTSNLVGDFYINNFLSGAVEIPAYVFSAFVYKRYGRQYPLMLLMLLAGISLVSTGLLPAGWGLAVVCLAMLGKFAITCTFSMVYVYTTELYPTSIRTVSLGACNAMSRVGGTLAPFAADFDDVLPCSSIVLFGILAILAGFSIFLLPETQGKKLPQTMKEGQELAKSAKVYCCLRGENATECSTS